MNHVLKSIVAGLAGIATAVIPTLIADALGHKYGLYATPGQPAGNMAFVVATIYRTAFGLAGSYVTARLAPNHPMRHSLVLGAIGTLAALGATIATWNNGPNFGPHWYPIALVVLGMPQSWAGAKLWLIQSTAA